MSESKRRRRLQICASNKLAGRPDVIKQIEEQGWLVEIEQCLDQCTRCSACAFALVSGRFLFAAGPEELLRKLR
jgi:uncharacterized protein YuzB (UPF0349 family)